MRVLVIYESTMGRTKKMAETICEGVESAGPECRLVEASDFDGVVEECAVAIGSSTRMKKTLPRVRQILAELPEVDGLPAAAFGSYGWSGEAPDIIAEHLKDSGAALIDESPLKVKDHPYGRDLDSCRELGIALAKKCSSES
jgi:flavorubredoxin